MRHRFFIVLSRFIPAAWIGFSSAYAAQVVVTVTGIVASGSDLSGVFGPLKDKTKPNKLDGQNFQLSFVFDDTQGQQSVSKCAGNVPCYSSIAISDWTNRSRAVLQIGGGTFNFGGTYPPPFSTNMSLFPFADASRSVPPAQSSVSFSIGSLSSTHAFVTIYPAPGTVLTTDYNWNAPFSSSNVAFNVTTPFSANSSVGNFEIVNFPLNYAAYANGILVPQSVAVSGPIQQGTCPDKNTEILMRAVKSGSLLRRADMMCTQAVTILDPVPDLLNGPQITAATTAADAVAGQPYLADLTKGRVVSGVAVDGVAQVVLQISASSIGQTFTLAVRPDQCNGLSPSDCVDEFGLIFDPAHPPSDIFNNRSPQTISVTAVSTINGPMAFAAYRAPADFVRLDPTAPDKENAQRSVFISINNGARPDQEIKLIRPPVALVHGLWATKDDLADLALGFLNDPRFSVSSLDYGEPIEVISGSPPIQGSFLIPIDFLITQTPIGSSLGFKHGADSVLPELEQGIANFKQGGNVTGLAVAAVGFDVVAHSMGALVARTLPFEGSNYYRDDTYQRGYIHKLVSLDGPHLGSPFATEILQPANECTRSIVSKLVNPSFDESPGVDAIVTQPSTHQEYVGPGAVGNLQGGSDSSVASLSVALSNLRQNPPAISIPTAYLAGRMSADQISRLIQPITFYRLCSDRHPDQCVDQPFEINNVQTLAYFCSDDPIGQKFLSQDAFENFLTSDSDGIVPLASQLNGLPASYSNTIPELAVLEGALHSTGTGKLYNLYDSDPEPTVLNTSNAERIKAILNVPVLRTDVFVP
jgi:hypothetical protein